MEQIYLEIYTFLPFDNFCRLKEYSNIITKSLNLPSWQDYFKIHNIKIVKISNKEKKEQIKQEIKE